MTNIDFLFLNEIDRKTESAALRRLKRLLSTPKGTMPLDREYGIDFSEIIDKPIPIAVNSFAVEAAEAVNRYEPKLSVSEVSIEDNKENGFRATVTLIFSGESLPDER